MRKLLVILLAVIFFALTTPSLTTAGDLLGAEATFPYPLHSKTLYVYWQKTGMKINYQTIGSGGRQRQFEQEVPKEISETMRYLGKERPDGTSLDSVDNS